MLRTLAALALLAAVPFEVRTERVRRPNTGVSPNGHADRVGGRVISAVVRGGSTPLVVDAGVLDLNGYAIPLALQQTQCSGPGTLFTESPRQQINCTRASSAYYTKSDGTLCLLGNDTCRRERMGLLVEIPSTNDITAPRDGTDASWVKVNVTATRATGADGVAAAGTTFTATAGSGSVLTTVTALAAIRSTSMRVRARTVTGAVYVSRNNLSTETDIGPSLSSTWKWVRARCGGNDPSGDDLNFSGIDNCIEVNALTSSVLNPVIGFQFANSGDAIDVDFVQDEALPYATSPMVGFARAVEYGTVALDGGLPVDNGEMSVDLVFNYQAGASSIAGVSVWVDTSAVTASPGTASYFDQSGGTWFEDQRNSGTGRTNLSTGSHYPPVAALGRNFRVDYGAGNVTIWSDGLRIKNSASNVLDAHTAPYTIGAFATHVDPMDGWIARVKWTAGVQTVGSAKTINLFGDSIVEGNGGAPNSRPQNYVSAFVGGRAVGKYIINSASSGATIDDCRTIWDAQVAQSVSWGVVPSNPQLLQCGINNSADDPAVVCGKIIAGHNIARDAGIATIASTITPWHAQATYVGAVNTCLRAWAPGAGFPLADTYAALVVSDGGDSLNSTYDFGDNVHLNGAGDQRMAGVWNNVARDAGIW